MAAAPVAVSLKPGHVGFIVEHMEEDDPDAPSVFPEWALLESCSPSLLLFFHRLLHPCSASQYRHMLHLAGPGSTVYFTSLSNASLASIQGALSPSGSSSSVSTSTANFELHTKSVTTLATERDWPLSSICLLDPRAKLSLSVIDAGLFDQAGQKVDQTKSVPPVEGRDGPFNLFLLGGILGDDPPRDRTGALRALGFPGRRLGGVQMTTDTALGVTKRVVCDGRRLGLAKRDRELAAKGAEGKKPAYDAGIAEAREKEKGSGAAGSPSTIEGDDDDEAIGAIRWVDYPTLSFGKHDSVDMPFRYMAETETEGVDEEARPLMPPGMRALIKKDLDRSFEF